MMRDTGKQQGPCGQSIRDTKTNARAEGRWSRKAAAACTSAGVGATRTGIGNSAWVQQSAMAVPLAQELAGEELAAPEVAKHTRWRSIAVAALHAEAKQLDRQLWHGDEQRRMVGDRRADEEEEGIRG